ncbi:ABC transporter permease [Nocardioides marmoriginsengisoli]|uniref:ABC transporter permease n=1 Tax=Nocardioides marmoriginsengisoli TaxID=661483 RepID=UPI001C82BDF1|nr:ABC transporter permease [Nocardioides marmoriginsengisoli]
MLAFIAGGFVLLSAVRVISGADEITSSGTLAVTLTATMPIALAGLGGLWAERAGVVNIGLEGMMIMGTLGAGYVTYHHGVLAGVLGAIAFGMIGGALHALATVIFGVDHIVSGVAINIIAAGIAGFLAEAWFTDLPGGGPTQSPSLADPGKINLSFLSEPASNLEDKHWFLVSDLASVVEMFTKNLSVLTLLGLALIVGSFFLLWRTRFGLRLRSCGEAPEAAESVGINVYRYKFTAVMISGGLAGLGGAYLALVSTSGFQVGQTQGRGYIGLAAMIFGNWRPTGMFMGSGLFGYTQALPFRDGTHSVHALLLVVAGLLVAVAVIQWLKGSRRNAIISVVLGAVFLTWYLTTDIVPADFTKMAPYVTTMLVLAFAAQRLRMPAADGRIYRKGSSG